jgi:SAM-dependent methyltransferase
LCLALVMATSRARYDSIADWYVEFTRRWEEQPNALLPDDVVGQRILDQGCGYGVACRQLARLGASVVGVDLSSEMLAHAQRIEKDSPLGVTYIRADATGTQWWDGRAFHGVLSNMALMDIDDLDGAMSVAGAVLRPGGWLSLSVFHPCYPGGPEGSFSGLPSWSPDLGYSHEGWWITKGAGVRGRVGANHRMLSTYLNAIIRSGFSLEEVAEYGESVPVTLVVRARRQP